MNERLFAAVAIAAALDVFTTCLVLRWGGQESNPLQRRLFRRIGALPAMLLTHGSLLLVLWLTLAAVRPGTLTLLALALGACAAWNARNALILRVTCRQK